MNWTELLDQAKMGDDIKVTLINPVRNREYFKEGSLTGFKSGTIGIKGHWIKKPKIQVTYSVYQMYPTKKCYQDWVDYDNCEFEIVTKKP